MARKSTQQEVTDHSRNLEEKARREQQAQKLLSLVDFMKTNVIPDKSVY